MAVTINNSPFHVSSTITRVFGYRDSGYRCGYHTGVDLVPLSSGGGNKDIYSVCNGQVINVINSTTQSLGTQVQIYDTDRNIYWRFCHMVLNSPTVSIGDTVTTSTKIRCNGRDRSSLSVRIYILRQAQAQAGYAAHF